jgi:hypothetical protein
MCIQKTPGLAFRAPGLAHPCLVSSFHRQPFALQFYCAPPHCFRSCPLIQSGARAALLLALVPAAAWGMPPATLVARCSPSQRAHPAARAPAGQLLPPCPQGLPPPPPLGCLAPALSAPLPRAGAPASTRRRAPPPPGLSPPPPCGPASEHSVTPNPQTTAPLKVKGAASGKDEGKQHT